MTFDQAMAIDCRDATLAELDEARVSIGEKKFSVRNRVGIGGCLWFLRDCNNKIDEINKADEARRDRRYGRR